MQPVSALNRPSSIEILERSSIEVTGFRAIEAAVFKEFPNLNKNWHNINPGFVLTIDGAAKTGKSTLGVILSKLYDQPFIDSGSLFMLVAHEALAKHLNLNDETSICEVAKEIKSNPSLVFRVKQDQIGDTLSYYLSYNGVEMTKRLTGEMMKDAASVISQYDSVRTVLKELQVALAAGGCITTGRKQWSEVFPNRGANIWIEADASARAERKVNALDRTSTDYRNRYQQELESIQSRDLRDKKNTIPPPSAISLYLNSTNLPILDCVLMSVRYTEKKLSETRFPQLSQATLPQLPAELSVN